MFTFLLVVQGVVAAALIGVILMQKSEGGGLGVGGSPAGFLSARGASDFLTRATAILATVFVALCIVLAVIASINHRSTSIDVDAAKGGAAAAPAIPGPVEGPAGVNIPLNPGAPVNPDDPLAGAAAAAGAAEPTKAGDAAQPQGVPLQQ